MAPPTYTPGQVLGAADCNNWFTPEAAYKTADQNVTSSTALVNDTDLHVALAANAFYLVLHSVFYKGGTAGASDLSFQWTVPAGTVLRLACVNQTTALVLSGGTQLTNTVTYTAGTNGTGNIMALQLQGHLTTTATTGNLQLQWAQHTSSATATTVGTGSNLVLIRIG